jgi:hypothetical protein
MVDNSMDPSHAMFLHAGGIFTPENVWPMAGFRLTDVDPWAAMRDPAISDVVQAVDEDESIDGKKKTRGMHRDGFVVAHKGYSTSNQAMNATRAFLMPCTGEKRCSW